MFIFLHAVYLEMIIYMEELQFYAFDGWNDLDITYSGSFVNGKIGSQTMYCLNGYTQSYRIPDNAWTCENAGDACVESVPTTYASLICIFHVYYIITIYILEQIQPLLHQQHIL